MKKVFLTAMLAAFSFVLYCQDFEVPENYKLEKAEDYKQYEPMVINGVAWLMATPFKDHEEKRKRTNAFLLQWMSGSPTVRLEIKPEIVTFMGSSPDLLMIFMGGWTKSSLETKEFNNKVAGSLAGIESVIEYYIKNKDAIKKDKNVEKFIKMKEKGTLREYIEKNA